MQAAKLRQVRCPARSAQDGSLQEPRGDAPRCSSDTPHDTTGHRDDRASRRTAAATRDTAYSLHNNTAHDERLTTPPTAKHGTAKGQGCPARHAVAPRDRA